LRDTGNSDRKGAHSFEVHDARARPIVLAGVGLGIGTAIVFVIVFWLFHYFTAKPSFEGTKNPMTSRDGTSGLNPAVPHIEEHPSAGYQDLRRREDQVLSSYGWVDKKAGVAHMPIDRAMDMVLQRGLPVRKEAAK